MKKGLQLITLLLFASVSFSQVSVAPRHTGKLKKFKNNEIEKFKNTTTVFVLSNLYNKEEYESILKDSWTVTPFKVILAKDFDVEKYVSDKYSIAQLRCFTGVTQNENSVDGEIYTFIDFCIFESDKIFNKLNKLSAEKREEKKIEIIDNNSLNVARVYLFPTAKFSYDALMGITHSAGYDVYNKTVLFNYKLGLLKNYFQKISNLISNNESYWLYKDEYRPELNKLSKEKLYVPSYITILSLGIKDSEVNNERATKIISKYGYDYEIIDDNKLSEKILSGEEFYYLRYCKISAERFLEVVNSKTGEILYRNYTPGYVMNLKSKHIKDINSKIKKAKTL